MKARILLCSIVFLLAVFTGNVSGGTEGTSNTFYGTDAGDHNDGDNNQVTFIGAMAGHLNTTGSYNTFVGHAAGDSNTTGSYNTFAGQMTGYLNADGSYNTFVGRYVGFDNTSGSYNTFLGYGVSTHNTDGSSNTFVGTYTGGDNTTGGSNTFFGSGAGYENTEGIGNVILGWHAGWHVTGSNKLYIANDPDITLIHGDFDNKHLTVNGNLNVISPSGLNRFSDNLTNSTQKLVRLTLRHYYISEAPIYLFGGTSAATNTYAHFGGGSSAYNAVTQMDFWTATNNTTLTGTSRLTIKGNGNVGIGTRTPANALQMAGGAYSNGSSWVSASSREYKDNIQSLKAKDAMETLQKLNPVTFSYKISPQENNVGFIAEDVPELLATKDRKGLSSMDIVAVLTKVVQEQQQAIQEQQKIAGEEEMAISIISAELKELKSNVKPKRATPVVKTSF